MYAFGIPPSLVYDAYLNIFANHPLSLSLHHLTHNAFKYISMKSYLALN